MSSFKNLGTVVDSKLSLNNNGVYVYKKAHQRLYLLRKLRSFGVGSHVLESVYHCLVESVLSFNIVTWYGHLSVKNRARLARVVNTASKIIGAKQSNCVTCTIFLSAGSQSLSFMTKHILLTSACSIYRPVDD